MPITSRFKLLFVHIPKNAGTSIEKALGLGTESQLFSYKKIKDTKIDYSRMVFNSATDRDEFINKTPQHLTLRQIYRLVGKNKVADYHKFAVVRNPFARIESEYAHINTISNPDFAPYVGLSLEAFLIAAFKLTKTARNAIFDGHLATQKSYVIDGTGVVAVDRVYKMETELEDCATFVKSITNVDLPHARETDLEVVPEIVWTQRAIDIVLREFEEDFDLFGYEKSFDKWVNQA